MQTDFGSLRILLPLRRRNVLISLFLAYLLNCVPSGPVLFVPDWLALVLCFWVIRQAPFANMSTAFILGLLMDVANGAVLGQHTFAYVLLAYLATLVAPRLLWLRVAQQGVLVWPLLTATQLSAAAIGILAGGSFPSWTYFMGPFIAALLWPLLTYLLLLPQFAPALHDENRPIHISKLPR